MTCDGRGKVPCPACDGAGSHSAPYIPSLGLYSVTLCTTCMGKKWAPGRCIGCEKCGPAAKGEAKTIETQGGLFKL